jgi:ubiquinone/menaquinone biosynthesis C-methylase UbiE
MSDALTRVTTRLAYAATQLPRLAWYAGHGYVMRQLRAQALHRGRDSARRRDDASAEPARPVNAPMPDQRRIYADLADLLAQDLANIEAGLYPLPADHDGSLMTRLRRSRLFFEDLPAVHRRRERKAYREVLTDATAGKRPDYYLQNVHYQSGGWLTADSADRYDTQVEVLFKGSANAMRRQALPPLHEIFAGRDQRRLRLLDIACGTGRFIDFVKQTWPRLPVVGLDLSEAYCRHARHHLRRWSRVHLVVGNAEALPAPDNSFDAVTCVFTFHELPPQVRRNAIRECARVLKPGGRLVLLDSLQRGDEPDYDWTLERFPQNYHEPYYSSYIGEDFAVIARRFGLTHKRDVKAFVSKVMVFDKPHKL